MFLPKLSIASATCIANSRVGANTINCGFFNETSILARAGKPKAAVLPVPVCASPNTSLPANNGGIVFA